MMCGERVCVCESARELVLNVFTTVLRLNREKHAIDGRTLDDEPLREQYHDIRCKS